MFLEKKAVCTGWIGRFGNRCHSYLYGKHLEDAFGLKFYIPSSWAGCVLFEHPAPVADPQLLAQARAAKQMSLRPPSVSEPDPRQTRATTAGGHVPMEFINPNLIEHYGKTDIAFSSLVVDAPWLYGRITRSSLLKYFNFTDEVRSTPCFRELEKARGTYDAAHFRRTDIAVPGFVGGHCMVSRESYQRACARHGIDHQRLVWVSDDNSVGWKWKGPVPVVQGRALPWLPDFLKLAFSRNLLRANSAFSFWAAWLGGAQVFSPLLHEYAPGRVIDVEFVSGNHPHWTAVKGLHACHEFKLADDLEEVPALAPARAVASALPPPAAIAAKAPQPPPVVPKIMMVHWNGRFGNRLFSYAFGRHYAEKFGHEFIIPSEWEGTVLFKEVGSRIVEDNELRLRLNQSTQPFDNLAARSKAVAQYGERTGQSLQYLNPDLPGDYGKTHVYFDSLCAFAPHIFDNYTMTDLRRWFEWSDEVRSLDVYKALEDRQGTYDIAHLRRDDISCPAYNKARPQAYSVISKDSYLKAFAKFGFDPAKVEWSSDDRTGKWLPRTPGPRQAGWTYPVGSHRVPDVIFDWLPDFLRLHFARTIFRSNSSFSWWAACLSPCAQVYSPVLRSRRLYLQEGDEIDCEFVEGNHPHWVNLASSNCAEIRIPR